MARTLKSDKLLFWATLVLVGISVVMVYSASAIPAMQGDLQSPIYFLVKQLVWAILGLGLLVAVMRVDYHYLRLPAVIWTVLGVTTVALIAVYFFTPRNNTYRWLSLAGVSVQPSELAKLAVILFAAALLERRMERINDFGYALLPIALVTGVLAMLIVLEPDFGTAVMVLLIVGAMVFAAGLSYRYLFGTAMMLMPAAFYLIVFTPWRRDRLLAFLHPAEHADGAGYQLHQSLIAIGSGGVLGHGLMAGIQKLYYIPEAHTDFIYAVVGEEFGLWGTSLVLSCFAIIAWRGLRAALLAPDRFGSLLAIGITTMVAVQAFVNISVNIGLMPTKGIPLPFVSNGGSSLLVNLVAMGILLNISQQVSPTAAAEIEGT
jgi:cell division protein FtsW